MRLDHKHALALLSLVDPSRVRSGRAVGLRDGAVLALAAAGLTTLEIAALPASAILTDGHRVVLSVERCGMHCLTVLKGELGRRLTTWLTEAKLWGSSETLFRGSRGPLTPMGIWKIIERYRSLEEAAAHREAA
jgi:hypothetical protein